MKEALLIRPGSKPEDDVWWCVLGSPEPPAQLQGWAQLSELSGHPLAKSVCLLIPASEAIFRDFTLVKKGPFSQMPQFSWLAEETLMGDVEDLHWTVVRKVANQVVAVAVNATQLQRWIDACRDAGLEPVKAIPDALLLPLNNDGATLVALDDQWWIRQSEAQATVIGAPLLPVVFERLGEGNHQCYGDMPANFSTAVEPNPWQHPLLLIQPELRAKKLNLLHGPFGQQADLKDEMRRWRKPLIGTLVLALLLSLLPQLANLWQVKTHQNEAEQQVQALFSDYFPKAKFTTNLKYHFTQQLKNPPRDFFFDIAQLDRARSAFNDIQMGVISYQGAQRSFTVKVTAPSKARVEAFVSQAKPTFIFEIEGGQENAAEKTFSAVLKSQAGKK